MELCQVKRHCKVFKQNYTSNSGSQSGNNRNSCSCANICTNTDSGSCGNICTNTDSSSNSQCCNSRIFFILENQYSSRIYSTNVTFLNTFNTIVPRRQLPLLSIGTLLGNSILYPSIVRLTGTLRSINSWLMLWLIEISSLFVLWSPSFISIRK